MRIRAALGVGAIALSASCASAPEPIAAPGVVLPPAAPAAKADPAEAARPPLASATSRVAMYSIPAGDGDGSLPTAGGLVRVRAPLHVAVAAATDFRHIVDLNPYVEKSVVVRKEGDDTDVYLRVPTVTNEHIWAILRFRPVPVAEGVAFRGRLVRGNLDDLRVFVHVAPVGKEESICRFELLAAPSMPLPRSWVVRDTRDGVHIMLERFRTRVEGSVRSSRPWSPPPVDSGDDVDEILPRVRRAP